jgi:hypothetical protein
VTIWQKKFKLSMGSGKQTLNRRLVAFLILTAGQKIDRHLEAGMSKMPEI